MRSYIRLLLILIVTLSITACKKYLDAKPDKSLFVPSTLQDEQALLDYYNVMNSTSNGCGEASADDYYLTNAGWSGLTQEGDRNLYIWEKEIIYNVIPNEWASSYQAVYYTNVVLETLDKIEKTKENENDWNNVKGIASFYRAKSFFTVVTTWAKTYDSATASTDAGIPLRLNSDFNIASVRSSVQQTYDQVISDVEASITLLPVMALHVMRPSKAAAYGLLARVYLSMRNYNKAALYADSSLQLYSTLMDFNSLNASAAYPIARFNAEVLFHYTGSVNPISNTRAKIDTTLFASYANNDLRKTVFFLKNTDGSVSFKGSYEGSVLLFMGLATDEMYLIKAECLARHGNTSLALSTLNTLLIKRWKTGTFIPLTAATNEQALNTILLERRKELVMRDLRWMDLKRLNKEPGHETTITRIINNQVYQLLPNDPKYALPIPGYIIDLTGMAQNPR